MILSTKAHVSRLAIFVFYDRDGIVDGYVCDILTKLQQVTMKIVLICNGKLTPEAKMIFEQYTSEVYERENYGLDAAAYKKGLLEYIGKEQAQNYDEVILLNDTFYGPLYDFKTICESMDERDVDFWGLSYGQKAIDYWKTTSYGYMPDHIQTFFISFRKTILQDDGFWSYWENYNDSMSTLLDVVEKHEKIMTKYFSDLGYKWEVYANQERFTSNIKELNVNNYHFAPHTMMAEMNFPFLKKKALLPEKTQYLYHEHGEEVNKALTYVIEETEYNEQFIWKNLLRLNNTSDLKSSLNMNFIFSKKKKTSGDIDFKSENIAIIVHLRHIERVSVILEYLNKIDKNIAVFIIAENEYIQNELINKQERERDFILLKSSNQETEIGALVLSCEKLFSKYEYICFLHDAIIKSYAMETVKDEIVKARFENTVVSDAFIEQVITHLKKNPHIGLLVTPFNTFNDYFYNYKNRWHGYYENTVQLLKDLDIKTNISSEKEPISIDYAFWCRSEALLPLWNRTYKAEEFICDPITENNSLNEALQRALPYVAQSQGYFTGLIMNDEFAAVEIENTFHYLRQILLTTERLGCNAGFYAGYIQQLEQASGGCPTNIQPIGLREALSNYYHKHFPKIICKLLDKIILRRK